MIQRFAMRRQMRALGGSVKLRGLGIRSAWGCGRREIAGSDVFHVKRLATRRSFAAGMFHVKQAETASGARERAPFHLKTARQGPAPRLAKPLATTVQGRGLLAIDPGETPILPLPVTVRRPKLLSNAKFREDLAEQRVGRDAAGDLR